MIDANLFGTRSNPNPRIRNPRSGKRGIRTMSKSNIKNYELRFRFNDIFLCTNNPTPGPSPKREGREDPTPGPSPKREGREDPTPGPSPKSEGS